MTTKKRYDNRFKAQVVLEAIKNQRTIAEIASEYGVHANQIHDLEGYPAQGIMSL